MFSLSELVELEIEDFQVACFLFQNFWNWPYNRFLYYAFLCRFTETGVITGHGNIFHGRVIGTGGSTAPGTMFSLSELLELEVDEFPVACFP